MNHFIYAVYYVSLKLMAKQKSRVDALKKKKEEEEERKGKKAQLQGKSPIYKCR